MENAKEYYTGDALLSYNSKLSMCVGAREIGKTFFFKKLVLKNWIKKKQEFIYLRRTQTELYEIDKEKFFPLELLNQAFKDFELISNTTNLAGTIILFTCSNKEYGLNKDTNRMLITSKKITINNIVVCYLKSLSTWVKLKGAEYDSVYTILYDEFLIDITSVHSRYLPNEYDALIQLSSTVFRRREGCRVIMLANATNYNNPYFNHFNFEGDNSKRFWPIKGTLPNGEKQVICVVEFPPMSMITPENNPSFYLLSQNTAVFESNIENKFQQKMNLNIGKIKGEKFRLYSVYCNGTCMTAYNAQGVIYIAKGFDKNATVYTFNLKEVENGFVYLNRSEGISKALRMAYYRGQLFFEDREVKTKFYEAIRPII